MLIAGLIQTMPSDIASLGKTMEDQSQNGPEPKWNLAKERPIRANRGFQQLSR